MENSTLCVNMVMLAYSCAGKSTGVQLALSAAIIYDFWFGGLAAFTSDESWGCLSDGREVLTDPSVEPALTTCVKAATA
ncbi:hypothetical protein MCOR27_001480 [Pyricularia oryzae]|nr:hypothetical protein MCOR19_001622 [Pyricularia oryzae]KAI6276641.1 hypothetical protein MCOR26_005542 [Pyricularia oryzae]KAI6287024.1 hypothetical protein MCOR27_001480 [Pyricularia oryzae]KAI6318998.1 hypothetical protein MCOR30_008764 [Pyricularia oryzae]KAI6341732.1 hypothetical protein MCOR28_005845 [Pyricularia oryzae]